MVTKPKLKRLGLNLLALFLCLTMISPALAGLNITAFAAQGDMNQGPGDGTITGDKKSFWHSKSGAYGARLTAVDALTGAVIQGSTINWSMEGPEYYYKGDSGVDSSRTYHFGLVSKTDYRNNPKLDWQDGEYVKYIPPTNFPKMIDGNITKIRSFFTAENHLKFYAANVYGLDIPANADGTYTLPENSDAEKFYNAIKDGTYDILVEPVSYFAYEGVVYACTATEAALLNKKLGSKLFNTIGNHTHITLPNALFPEKDHANLGYTKGRPKYDKYYTVDGVQKGYYSDDAIIDRSLGIGIVWCNDPTQPPTVHHHIYNMKLNVPKGSTLSYNGRDIPLSTANITKILKGSPVKDDKGASVTGGAELAKAMLNYCNAKGFIASKDASGVGVWENVISYQIDNKTEPASGFFKNTAGDLVYRAPLDQRYATEVTGKYGTPYLLMSYETAKSASPIPTTYVGPETNNKDDVIWRYGGNGSAFTSINATDPAVQFRQLDLSLNAILNLMPNLVGSTGKTNFSGDAGLYTPAAGQAYHTATLVITAEDAPAPVYYHTATYDVKLDPTDPVPTSLTEVQKLVKDKGIKPKWTTEKGSTKEAAYNPLADPKLVGITGSISTGYITGASGFNPKLDPIPTEYPDTTTAKQKLENVQPDFDTLKNITQVTGVLAVSDKGLEEIHTAVVKFNIQPARELEFGTDRIKTYDVTQWIDGTKDAVSSSKHLNTLNSSVKTDASGYNTKYFKSYTHGTHANNENSLAVMQSEVLKFDPLEDVKTKNCLDTDPCGFSDSHTHHNGYCSGHYAGTDADGNEIYDDCDDPHCTDSDHSESCSFVLYICPYTRESVTPYFGLYVSQPTHYEEGSPGSLKVKSGFKSGSTLAAQSSFSDVGFTIPSKYYSNPDVVKFAGSNKYSGSDMWYMLPNEVGKAAQSNKYATFDVLYNINNTYRVKYYNGNNQVGTANHMQYAQQSQNDKKQDYTDKDAHIDFGYTEGNSHNAINGVQFIAHRDLTSGDNVATSLAVSGYMAKYANNSQTYKYLEFMRDCGFAFNLNGGALPAQNMLDATGVNTLNHVNRMIQIANGASVNDLAATSDGYDKTAYNTNYVGGKGETLLKTDTHIRMGLGGLSADATSIYKLIDKSALMNSSLDTMQDKGDALRSIWYMVDDYIASETHFLDCNNHANQTQHDWWDACSDSEHGDLAEHHVPGTWPLHEPAKDDIHKPRTYVSGNNYILHDGGSYLPNGYYNNHLVYGNTYQSDMFKDILTSRVEFRIPLAVEGTTNGQWDGTGTNGISYRTDILKLNSNNQLTHKPSAEMSGTDAAKQKTYEETTFEVLKNNLATVGKTSSTTEKNHVQTEYRFSSPTDKMHFNPSVAMAFDDDFNDVNKSVWMLSEQPREITLKNILDIRLTHNGQDNANSSSAKSGYTTKIDSSWSTDNTDKKVQSVTGLPTMKASSAYRTETSASGGTITAYVVLQDPEFTADPAGVQTHNNLVMQQFNAQMEEIRKQVADAAGGSLSSSDKFGLAMYTNLTNGSSVNSMFSKPGSKFTSSDILADKEPMILADTTKLSAKVNTGSSADISTGVDNNSWTYYALSGYEVKNLYKTVPDNTDISDTISSGQRKIFGKVIKAQKDAPAYQKEQLNELNEHLKSLMFEQGESVDAPQGTTPFLQGSGAQEFAWYNEDYEGFVVAVYEIEFEVGGKNGSIANTNAATAATRAKTDFHSAYRSESDWKANTNETITSSDRSLIVNYINLLNSLGITNVVDNSKANSTFKNGKLDLVTKDGRKALAEWAKNLKKDKVTYEPEIYGVGLELANLKIGFGKIGKDNPQCISFFYQPTYFNVRGSVYDTAG